MEEKPPSPVEEVEATAAEVKASLFPLASSSQHASTSLPQWLSNSSFTTDISVINDAVASQLNHETTLSPREEHDLEDEGPLDNQAQPKPFSSYEILESSESDREEERGRERKSRKKKKKKRKRDGSSEKGGVHDYGSRKSRVRTWADSETKTTKDYYFDSRGDRDNLAFGCIYRYSFLLNLWTCVSVFVIIIYWAFCL